ncbi:metallophosphoesterase [Amaricoccus tamworthensis]|uniref:metallophosphoesterase n=1 Tax=Amaricoccus tamworthensis TaxID=57002 RepID=UPI003C7A9912
MSFFRRKRSSNSDSGEDGTVSEPKIFPDERIYAVGDIHGRDDLLLAMFEAIGNDITAHSDNRVARLVFLGDLIDRGDHSRNVLDIITKTIAAEKENNIICLRGNHEQALLDFIRDPLVKRGWLQFGGLQTIGSYGLTAPRGRTSDAELTRLRDELKQAMGPHLDFLSTLPLSFRSGDVFFAHAGIDPARPLSDQSERALLWGKSSFLTEDGLPGVKVVHGHYDSADVVSTPGRICVDLGAYYSGCLCAVRLDDEVNVIKVTA